MRLHRSAGVIRGSQPGRRWLRTLSLMLQTMQVQQYSHIGIKTAPAHTIKHMQMQVAKGGT